jgi:hypothetical protein
MAPQVRKLVADHAGNAQVTVLRSRTAVRRYLAASATAGHPSVQATGPP